MKIIIVGSGISGLWLSIELSKRYPSASILVIDKYPYIGGRTTTYKKDISGTHIQWEKGAGRIHESHRKVLNLLDKYRLHKYPINPDALYYDGAEMKPNNFEYLIKCIEPLMKLPKHILATMTLRQITDILGLSWIWRQFPYDAEVSTLRADIALQSFLRGEMQSASNYYVIQEGFGELIARMRKEAEGRGIKLKTGIEVIKVMPGIRPKVIARIHRNASASDLARGNITQNITKELTADKIIFATHLLGLKGIEGFSEWPLLNYLKMRPLIRIYAKFPEPVWFKGIPKVISNTKFRYFIPIDENAGTAMISYTDARYADGLLSRIDKGKTEESRVVSEILDDLRHVFKVDIPAPELVKVYAWSEGATYWLPGNYSPDAISHQSLQPYPNIYVCGESFCMRQAWVEGALEQAEKLLQVFSI